MRNWKNFVRAFLILASSVLLFNCSGGSSEGEISSEFRGESAGIEKKGSYESVLNGEKTIDEGGIFNDAGPPHESIAEGILEKLPSEKSSSEDLPESSAKPQPIQFPRDEAPHDVPVEWWYYTGVLEVQGGKPARFGFEMVTFQFKMLSRKAYVMQFAVTDVGRKKFAHGTKFTFKPQVQPKKGFRLSIGSWSMEGSGGQDKLRASLKDYELSISLKALKPPVFHYGKGYMFLAKKKPFYYYSYTRMKASGTLKAQGKTYRVSGRAWMDHQWGESGRIGKDFDGWDWFSLRFDDRTEVMLFLLRGTTVGHIAGGTYVDASGKAFELKPGDFQVKSLSNWTSPKTKAVYPQNWQIKIPKFGIDVVLTAVMSDQEVIGSQRDKSSIYWEGLCDIAGQKGKGKAGGEAYVELTGYVK